MRKYLLGLIFVSAFAHAGLISHSDYSSGATITAAGQNANENTIVNEFNGNIESVNIKDGTIVAADISASANIAVSQLDSTVSSTLTYVNTFGGYRRPNLVYSDRVTVLAENNTGTSNQTCIQFPDSQRCVTVSNGLRAMALTTSANFTSADASGIRSGYVLTNNTWYSVYAVKSQDVSTQYVLVADTLTVKASNVSTLNTAFGSNGWVYLGVIRYGNKNNNTNSIVKFTQAGDYTVFISSVSGNAVTGSGIDEVGGTSSTSISYTYSAGSSNTNIPDNLTVCMWAGATSDATNIGTIQNQAGTYNKEGFIGSLGNASLGCTEGVKMITGGGGTNLDIFLTGFIDGALGIGYNPQI